MKGKLLHCVESFSWVDNAVDRSQNLQDFNSAIIDARENGDNIYCPESMFYPENSKVIFQFMWCYEYQSYEQIKEHFEWLSVDDFQLLQTIGYSLGQPTPKSSNDWQTFKSEFAGENTSLIGLETGKSSSPLVHNKHTYFEFHSKYVTNFDFEKQKECFDYFIKFYKPALKINSKKINDQIEKKQISNQFIRIDDPQTAPDGKPLHGQQVHAHLLVKNSECALNIDGTWKHSPKNIVSDKIPVELCIQLSSWGFCLPRDYYD